MKSNVPSFAEWRRNKIVYGRWGKARNPAIELFQQALEESGKSLRWVARRTGVSEACLQNWMPGGPTRHPSMRTWPYVMREAFGIDVLDPRVWAAAHRRNAKLEEEKL